MISALGLGDFTVFPRSFPNFADPEHDKAKQRENEDRNDAARQAREGPFDNLISLVHPRFQIENRDDVILVELMNVAFETMGLHAMSNARDVEGEESKAIPMLRCVGSYYAVQDAAERLSKNSKNEKGEDRRQDERDREESEKHKSKELVISVFKRTESNIRHEPGD
jgi:hypothetical protein